VQPEALAKPARKRLIQRYLREEVDPRLHAREVQWQAHERTKYVLRGAAVTIDAAAHSVVCRAVRPWAQLRLQGRLSVADGQASSKCRWCLQECAADGTHFLVCRSAASAAADAVAGTPWEGTPAPEVWRLLRDDADTLTSITVARRLALAGGEKKGAASVDVQRLPAQAALGQAVGSR